MIFKNCIVCGDKFIKRSNESLKNWSIHRFCSKECSNIFWKGKIKNNKTLFTKERHYVPTTAIKKGQHLSLNTEFKKGNKLSEETKLKMKGRIPWNYGSEWKEMSKENNPNWKGGRTVLRLAIRTTTKYKKWRTLVFIRDNYKCCECGHVGKTLQVHHIKPFYKIVEENNVKTIEDAKNCKELWDIDNGQTLCISCHKQTDSYLVNQYNKTQKQI